MTRQQREIKKTAIHLAVVNSLPSPITSIDFDLSSLQWNATAVEEFHQTWNSNSKFSILLDVDTLYLRKWKKVIFIEFNAVLKTSRETQTFCRTSACHQLGIFISLCCLICWWKISFPASPSSSSLSTQISVNWQKDFWNRTSRCWENWKNVWKKTVLLKNLVLPVFRSTVFHRI